MESHLLYIQEMTVQTFQIFLRNSSMILHQRTNAVADSYLGGVTNTFFIFSLLSCHYHLQVSTVFPANLFLNDKICHFRLAMHISS